MGNDGAGRPHARRCALYRCQVPELVAALADGGLIRRWLVVLDEERPALADAPLLALCRELRCTAARVLAAGFATAAREDRAGCDALLSDVLAVATWRGWELPLAALGDGEVEVGDLPRGLLGADRADGAGVWVLDGATIALARPRQAAAQADWSSHRPCPGGAGATAG